MSKSIILIGNGPSVRDYEFGDRIDSYDVAVRFNWFHIKGFEKHVGTKTTIWFTTVFCETRLREHQFERIYTHSWEWDAEKDQKLYQRMLSAHGNVTKTKRECILEIQDFVGSADYFCYSTGAIAAWMLLQEFEPVTLFGFDWWENRDKHHYGDNQTIGGIHKPEFEHKLFSKLARLNKIVDLNPNTKLT